METTPPNELREISMDETKRLYRSCLNIIDRLLKKTPDSKHAEDFKMMMRTFSQGQLAVKVYSKEKGWDPSHRWKIGEHSGFVVQLRNKDLRQTLFINVYGGLRVQTKGIDMRDSDITNTNIHNHRTESVLCNSTNIFLKLIDSSGDTQAQVIFFREPDKTFFLRSFEIRNNTGNDKRSFDYRRVIIDRTDPDFEEISGNFSQACNYFTKNIESFIKN